MLSITAVCLKKNPEKSRIIEVCFALCPAACLLAYIYAHENIPGISACSCQTHWPCCRRFKVRARFPFEGQLDVLLLFSHDDDMAWRLQWQGSTLDRSRWAAAIVRLHSMSIWSFVYLFKSTRAETLKTCPASSGGASAMCHTQIDFERQAERRVWMYLVHCAEYYILKK